MTTKQKKVFIETYGCQMNFADSEVVASILKEDGYELTDEDKKTFGITDKAQQPSADLP